jgi:hypothetical protein
MAKTIYERTAISGGGSALDGIDGSILLDGDAAVILINGAALFYVLDDDSASGELLPEIVAPDANPGNKRWIRQNTSGEIDSCIFATLSAANAAAAAAGKLLVISTNWTLVANTTLTASVKCIPGGSFTKASTYTLTFSGSFENPSNGQCFIGFAAGEVTFGAGAVEGVRPEWWAVNTTPGTTDMSTAVLCAVASGANYIFNGIYLVSSKIEIDKAAHLEFLGPHGTISGDPPASYLKKAATMTEEVLLFSHANASMNGGGVVGVAGNTGDNIVIAGNSVRLRNVTSIGAGQDGIRVGKDADGSNMNSWLLDSCFAHTNGRHGFYISDAVSTATTDANAGVSTNCGAMSNAGDGMRLNFAMHNSIIGFLGESNTGYGLWVGGAYNMVFGGDRESNIAGNLYIPSGSLYTKLYAFNPDEVTDDSFVSPASRNTVRGERYIINQGTWTPVIYGSAVAGTNTYSQQYGRWYRDGDMVTLDCRIVMTAKDLAMDGDIYISGIPFAYPATLTNGLASASIGRWANINLDANYTQLGVTLAANSDVMLISEAGSGQLLINLVAASITDTTTLMFSIRYPIAAF